MDHGVGHLEVAVAARLAAGLADDQVAAVPLQKTGDMRVGGEDAGSDRPGRALEHLFAVAIDLDDGIGGGLELVDEVLVDHLLLDVLGDRGHDIAHRGEALLGEDEIGGDAGGDDDQAGSDGRLDAAHALERLAGRLEFRLDQRLLEIGDRGGAFRDLGDDDGSLSAAEADPGPVGDCLAGSGRGAVDLDGALTEDLDSVVAGWLAVELAVLPADGAVFGPENHVGSGLAAEDDRLLGRIERDRRRLLPRPRLEPVPDPSRCSPPASARS